MQMPSQTKSRALGSFSKSGGQLPIQQTHPITDKFGVHYEKINWGSEDVHISVFESDSFEGLVDIIKGFDLTVFDIYGLRNGNLLDENFQQLKDEIHTEQEQQLQAEIVRAVKDRSHKAFWRGLFKGLTPNF